MQSHPPSSQEVLDQGACEPESSSRGQRCVATQSMLQQVLLVTVAGASMQFDAGSCIDGRLTSAWNWGSKIEKKEYYHIFKICGFVGVALPLSASLATLLSAGMLWRLDRPALDAVHSSILAMYVTLRGKAQCFQGADLALTQWLTCALAQALMENSRAECHHLSCSAAAHERAPSDRRCYVCTSPGDPATCSTVSEVLKGVFRLLVWHVVGCSKCGATVLSMACNRWGYRRPLRIGEGTQWVSASAMIAVPLVRSSMPNFLEAVHT